VEVQTRSSTLLAFLVGIVDGTHRGVARVGDKVGRIPVMMWFLDPGPAAVALMLPNAKLFWTGVLPNVDDDQARPLSNPGLCAGV